LTFEFDLNALLNTIISLVFGAIITLKIVERNKTAQKRKIMLEVLLKELEAYDGHKEDYDVGSPGIGTPQRHYIFWNVLSSDILDVNKDKELIIGIQEMVGWIENYNSMNNMANLGYLLQSPTSKTYREARDILNQESFKHSKKLIEIVKNI
jgi:hypothetical protein